MFRTYQYRLRPNQTAKAALRAVLDQDRALYNAALQERKEAWEKCGKLIHDSEKCGIAPDKQLSSVWENARKKVSLYGQCQALTAIRADDADFAAGHMKRQRGPLKRLDRAFKAFFRRLNAGEKPGYPRFKGRDRWDSIEIEEGYSIRGVRFYSKDFPGGVKIHMHRSLPDNLVRHCGAVLKQDGKGWLINLKIAIPDVEERPVFSAVGIDVGLNAFAATSDGDFIPAPKHFRRAEKKLRVLQRRLSRAKPGSGARRKKRNAVARLHAKTRNQRRDFHHQEARRLVNRYDVICAEDLAVKNMVKNRHLSKSIADAGWAAFLDKIAYKAEEAGKRFIQVDPRNTSQRCSGCGELVPKALSVRVHKCAACGLRTDRDHNAALNIKRLGLSLAPWSSGLPEFGAEACQSGFP